MKTLKDQEPQVAAVIGYRDDGLGARLMALGNGVRLARKFGCGFRFIWTTEPDVANIRDPSALFDVPAMAKAGIHFTTFGDEFVRSLEPRLIFNAGHQKAIDLAAVPRGSTLLVTYHRAQRVDNESQIVARKGLSKSMKSIVPTPKIAGRVDAFVSEHDLTSAIGVHVRRGDILRPDYPLRDQRAIELDHYFAVLNINRVNDEIIFLCTEDTSVIEAFETRYPNRVIRFPTRSWDRDDKEAVEDALVEIIALSRTSFVIAGPSAFNRAATGLGFIPLLNVANTSRGEPRNFVIAAQEFMKFRMIERAALNMAACQSAPDSEQLSEARRRLEVASVKTTSLPR